MVHPIEVGPTASCARASTLSHLPPLTRAVVERVVHASADLDYADDLVCDEAAWRAHAALRAGAPVVTDVEMVAAGITRAAWSWSARSPSGRRALGRSPGYPLGAGRPARVRARWGPARSGWSAARRPRWTNCSPGRRTGAGHRPAGRLRRAAESKAALRASGLPAVRNVSEKGGSAVAAAALNALLYLEEKS